MNPDPGRKTTNPHPPRGIAGLVGVLLLLMIFAPFSMGITTTTQAEGNEAYLEGFETYDVLTSPGTGDDNSPYTHQSGSGSTSYVTTSTANNGSKSWKVANSGSLGGNSLSNWDNVNFCDGGFVEFDWYMSSLPSGAALHVGLSDQRRNQWNDGGSGFTIGISTAGAVTAALMPNDSNFFTSINLGLTISANTWYRFRFSNADCVGNAGFTLTEITTESQVTLSTSDTVDGNFDTFTMGPPSNTGSSYTAFVDDLEMPKAATPPPDDTIGAADFAAFTDLTWVEADTDILAFVVKHGGGSDISTINPLTLSAGAEATTTTTCVFDDGGIATNLDQVIYVDCSGTTPNEMVLTDLFLDPPTYPATCGGCGNRFPIPDDFVNEMVITDSLSSTNGINRITFGFQNPTDNNIHMARLVANENAFPTENTVHRETLYSSGSSLQDLCTSNDNTYWAAGGELMQVGVLEGGGGPSDFSINKQFETGFTGTSDVKCAQSAVAFKSGGVITVVAKTNLNNKITISDNSPKFALSKDGAFLYTSNGNLYATSNGTKVGETAIPTGTLVDVFIDNTAQNTWYATSNGITQFSVFTETTGTPESTSAGGGFTDPTFTGVGGEPVQPGENFITTPPTEGDQADGILGTTITFVSESWGFSTTAVGALIGLTIMVGITVGMAANGRGSIGGTALLGGAGIMISGVINLFLGLWPVWVMLVMAFVAVAIVGNMLFSTRGDGDA